MNTNKYDRLCNSCCYLTFEEWPHGAGAARCMHPAENMNGRTLQYSETNRFVNVFTPVRCKDGALLNVDQ